MATKKKTSISRFLLSLLMGVPTLFHLAEKVVALIILEARLASRNIIHLLILAVMFAIVCTSTWLCVLMMVFFYLSEHAWSIESSLSIIFLLNIILLALLLFGMNHCKKKFIFSKTRKRLRHAHHRDYGD